jgi:glycosyltransferase involved in cell wall biosynthesis
MDNWPLITIITPSYNQAQFLETTIRSVLDQNYPHLEYFIVDGGSSDNSVNIICRFEPHLSWWISEPDQGQAEAINKGLLRARGEIIGWINSDDYYLPNALHNIAQFFQANPSVVLVYGNVISVDEQGLPFYLQSFKPYTLDDLMAFQIISQPGVFFRREVLLSTGLLDPSYHFLLDHHLWLRIASVGSIAYLPFNLAAARYHPSAKNVAQAFSFSQEVFRIVDWMKTCTSLQNRFEQNKARILGGAYRLSAYYLVEAAQYWAGLRAYALAFRWWPPVVLKEWRRILFTGLGLFGFDEVRQLYRRWQKKRL